jgi:hypothetical protein
MKMLSPVILATPIQPPELLPAQGAQPTRPLTKPVAEFEEPLTAISSIREAPDGRVAVVRPEHIGSE